MTINPYAHSYAAQFATEQGFEVYSGSDRILFETRKTYDIVPQNTRIAAYKSMYEQMSVIVDLKSYDELRKLGLVITKVPMNYYWFGQYRRYRYHIVPENKVNDDYGAIPPEHEIQHNTTYHAVRLVGSHAGRTAHGEWVKYKKKDEYKNEAERVAKTAAEIRKSWTPASMINDEVLEIPVKEIMVLYHPITQVRYCIEQEQDEPRILISGSSGGGKSYLMNRLISNARWKWNKNIAVLNDYQGECLCWSDTWTDGSKQGTDLIGLGEKSVPLPAVYLYLSGKDDEKIPYEGYAGFRISLPFRKLILDYENLLREKKGWQMDKLMSRFKNMITDKEGKPREDFFQMVEDCRDFEEIAEFIKAEMQSHASAMGLNARSVAGMTEKILSVLKDIYNEGFMDFSSKIPAEWCVKKENVVKFFPPWIAALYCGLVPIFETTRYHTRDYFPLVVKHVIETIFDYQKGKKDSYFKDNDIQVWCAIDEIPKIVRNDKGRTTLATEKIADIAATGRFNRMGLLAATQNYSYIPERVISNTNFHFAFTQPSHEEARLIGRNFSLSKDWVDKIKNLKKFECVGMTKDDHFITYDLFGRRGETTGPVEGIVMPPLNQHSAPRKLAEI